MLSRIDRAFFAVVAAAALSWLGAGAYATWRETAAQGWRELGYGWLALDLWTRAAPWRAGLAGALLALLVCGLAALARARRLPGANALEAAARALGEPLVAGSAAALAWLLPATLASLSWPRPPAGARDVLVIVVDTWRADHAGFLGYERDTTPNLDRLVRSGVVFERAQAQAGWTKPSVATLLTGVMPSRHHAVSQPVLGRSVRGTNLPPAATTLVEVLRARGWDTAMWSANPNIVPARGFAQGAARFTDYFGDPRRTESFDPGSAERMLPAVEAWLREQRDQTRPFCAYVHLMDPHYPYEPPAPWRGRLGPEGPQAPAGRFDGAVVTDYLEGERDAAAVSPERLRALIDRYDEEILYVDHWLGAFLERVLREHPDTLVVLAGDHGEEFLDHGLFGHAHTLYQELLHVPLVLWSSDLPARRVATQVRLLDVLPTVLELAGVVDALPPGVQGESLVPVADGRETADRPAPAETGGDERPAWHWRALSDGRLKMIRREADLPTALPLPSLAPWDRSAPRPTWLLFDVLADPAEQHDLHAEEREAAERLFALMRARGWWTAPEALLSLRRRAPDVAPDDLPALRALGYAGEDAP